MRRGFATKKTNAVIAREILETTGEAVNPRTVGRRAQEWRELQRATEASMEEIRGLVAAMKEGDLTSSDMVQALAMQSLVQNAGDYGKQNPLKLQSQNLRAEEIGLKKQVIALKQREIEVTEAKLKLLQEREDRAKAILAEVGKNPERGKSLTTEDMNRIREVYGLEP
jgi:hypothetical protein